MGSVTNVLGRDAVRVGSLCTGIAGLELGLRLAGINVEPVFVSDIDDGANTWLAANMPDTPNLGDFTALDELPEVDLITAGFPCQPVSTAGLRKGVEDERWIFDDIARLVGRMGSRPLLFVENVSGLLSANDRRAFSRVVHGLADIGYSLTWGTLPAAAIGAPHRRNRWWGLAYPADATSTEWRGSKQQDLPSPTGSAPESGERSSSLADRFGPYAPAINRWERILGRPAPDPTDNGRLNPPFVEWMMGYPSDWVTGTLTRRNDSLKALGNAVVPQCAAAAFTQLASRLPQCTDQTSTTTWNSPASSSSDGISTKTNP